MKRYLLSLALLCLVATGAHAYWQSRAQVAVSAGGGALSFTSSVTTVAWQSSPSPTSINFTADIGTASSDRVVVVAVAMDASNVAMAITGVTINGVAATKDSFFDPPGTINGALYIFHALVTSGSGAQTIAVAFGSFPGGIGIAVGMITGSATAAFSAGNTKAFVASQPDPQTMTSTAIPANGIGVVCTIIDRPATPAWVGPTTLAKTTTGGTGSLTLSLASTSIATPSYNGANNFGVGMAMTTFAP